ncbi:type IX secretion system sortase PorU [soil metagenome]
MHQFWFNIIALVLILFCVNTLQGQQLTIVTENDRFTDYHFINDSLEIVHVYEFLIETNANNVFSITEQQVVTRTIKREPDPLIEAFALSGSNTPLFDIVNPGIHRGQETANLRFHPVRFSENNPNEMLIVREARFRVYKSQSQRRTQQSVSRLVQSEHSPLAEGVWYKIPIETNGIHQLNSSYLEELGVSVSQLNPDHIQIWGIPGGELPRLNSAERPQLVQIPIFIEGDDNGSFDASDRILFYTDSPHQVFRDVDTNSFSHQLHRYSDQHHIYLHISANGESKRLKEESTAGTGNQITEFRDFTWFEEDLYKSEPRIRSGLEWYGTRFSNSSGQQRQTIFEETIPGLIPNREMDIEIQFVGSSTRSMAMDFSYNGTNLGSANVPSIQSYRSEEGVSGRLRTFATSATIQNAAQIQLEAQLNAPEPTSKGFIDWIRLTYDRELVADDDFLFIYSPSSVENQTGSYLVRGFSGTPKVMEVSDPQNPVLLSVSGTSDQYNFSYQHQQDHQFIAQSAFYIPEAGYRISNQNLRGISTFPDYVIVTSEFFRDLAEEWASYRQEKDNFQTVVVTQEQIFNEFSGGTPDVTAIRDYIKFLYDRAQTNGREPLQHLLLFGDATYDYRKILDGAITNHVFTFQSDESLHRINSYGSDDYFGLLDDDEGEWLPFDSSERLDIGIGRFPVNTASEARVVMDKIREYESPETAGDWRTRFTFAADDDFPDIERNRDLHLLNADGTALELDKTESATRVDKIYMLSYPVETSAAGRRVPGATRDFIDAFNNGSLVINYSGHGGQYVLADELLFTDEMISRLTNRDRQSIFVTATCQFGRYDDTDSRSGAEQTLLWNQGGTVATFTTTRVVFTSASPGSNNFGLNIQLTRQMVERDTDGRPQRLGDIYRRTKNTSQGSGFNARKFILLGDPAMRIGLPEAKAQITRINDVDLESSPDSLVQIRALDRMQIEGVVKDNQGNFLSDFNGETTVTVFDSERIVNLPDKFWVQEGRCFQPNCQYSVENDVLFNGRVSVNNGIFSTEFIVPRDITFSEDRGRILAYTTTNGIDGSGSADNIVFNGINPDAPDDTDGPVIDVYLNDANFANGNLVGSSSTLIVDLEDESGINTTGTGVGHEIIATIDTNPRQTIVLNEFYQSDLDDFRKGRIEYPLEDLPQGSYTLNVRAWDVYNNPEEATIFFAVADSDQLEIRNAYNYPNPMSRNTRFVFEHNQPGNLLDISIRIYTLSGLPVMHLQESQISSNSYANIEWNGLDRDYDRLANGTYIYVLRVGADTPEGKQTQEKIEKLVIIR